MRDVLRVWRWRRELRHWWQRRMRGWDDSDTWNIDFWLWRELGPRIARLRQVQNGYPMGMSESSWDDVLAEVQWFCEYMVAGEMWPVETDPEFLRVMRAYGLFVKYLPTMWW